VTIQEAQAVIIPSNARGVVSGHSMAMGAVTFPTAFQQYQNMCNQRVWREDAVGRVRWRSTLEPGDSLVFVDLTPDDYRGVLESITEANPEKDELHHMYREKQKYVFFPIVKTRPDKKFSIDSFKRSMKRIKEIAVQEAITEMLLLDDLNDDTHTAQVRQILDDMFEQDGIHVTTK